VYEILYDEKSIEFFKDTKYKKNDILLTPTLEQKLNEVNNMILEFSLITTIV
jgi:hypothetical protein